LINQQLMPQPITITLPDDLRLAVIEIARSEGIDAETVIAEAVRQYVQRRLRAIRKRLIAKGREEGWEDPIVKEVREARAKIWEECGGDMNKLWERIKAAEAEHPERLITKEEFDRRRGR
jgi:predicted transcriptional regulator